MLLKATRFVAVLARGADAGLELLPFDALPSRMAWDQYLWVGSTVQGGLYAMFGSIGAMIFVATVSRLGCLRISCTSMAAPAFALALAAAVLFLLALVLWWVLVYPVNVELAKWVNGPVPADWTEYRARWEWGHAIIALVELIGFAALTWSVLADTPRNASS